MDKIEIKDLSRTIFVYILGTIVLPALAAIAFSTSIISALVVFFAITTVYMLMSTKLNYSQLKERKTYLWGILLGLGLILIQYIINYILLFLGFNMNSGNTQTISALIKSNAFVIILVVICAPIMEELIFRRGMFGYIMQTNKIKNNILKMLLALLLPGIIFALLHDGFSILIVTYITLSILFSLSYYKTNNIWIPILGHFTMNSFVVIITLLSM